MTRFADVLARLVATIETRRGADPATSWSARLIADPQLAAKKLGEEALETALAAAQGDRSAIAAESADLVYHWLALLAATGVSLDEVAAVLESREGSSGIQEKARRGR
ncbi:MAG TPA: phosphoribosyl-ATP diphosphatase [Caulobacteraceae bacterium]|nr:phosphoribosyl-ATP diphosphatase [Caulobacteraceae bacterium]